MKVLSAMFLLLWLLASSSMTWAENVIVLGDDGPITEEQADTATDADKDKKAKKAKKAKKGDSEEEPDCE